MGVPRGGGRERGKCIAMGGWGVCGWLWCGGFCGGVGGGGGGFIWRVMRDARWRYK